MWWFVVLLCGLSVFDQSWADILSVSPSLVQSTSTVSSASPDPKVTTDPPIEPVSPSKQVKYVMHIENTGPAVLDSSIEFTAQLVPVNGHIAGLQTTKFLYQWMSMGDMTVHTTIGNFSSKIKLTFPSLTVQSGEYLITVAAFFEEDKSKIAAFQVNKFVLTDKLNGQLILEQMLEFQRFPNVLSTNSPTTLIADVRDRFQAEYNLTYEYFWYNNGEFIKDTEKPIISTEVGTPTNSTMMAVVIASFQEHYAGKSSKNYRWHKHTPEMDLDRWNPLIKNGQFKQQAIFKDPLDDCEVVRVDADQGDHTVNVGSFFLVNITCLGSGPSGVCLNITEYNVSIPLHDSCQPIIFTDTLQHQVKITLNSSGWVDVHFYIFNDVSRQYKVSSYFGYDPDSVNVPALVFPTVFGVFGVIIIVLGALYIMRLRKKPLVEVADFDFHPNLTSSQGQDPSIGGLGRLTNSFKYFLLRSRLSTEQRQSRVHRQHSLVEESTDVKGLYGSL